MIKPLFTVHKEYLLPFHFRFNLQIQVKKADEQIQASGSEVILLALIHSKLYHFIQHYFVLLQFRLYQYNARMSKKVLPEIFFKMNGLEVRICSSTAI